jgi:GT2 family glycosyltransferase
MNSSLSIIIPTYKRKDSLIRLLNALLEQTDVVPEIIVVDQNAAEFLAGALPAATNIKRLLLEKPNASDARNQGFRQSTGEFILFIDDDLLPAADFCRKGMAIFATYPAIGCFSPLVYNDQGRELALQQAASKLIGRLDANPEIFSITDTISAALFCRRPYFNQTGGFDPMLFDFAKTAEDQEFFLRMRKKTLELYFVPSVEVFHDETVPGGCDLRTTQYWITREKCMRSWAYRYRIHHALPGRLSLGDILRLSRSGFLNREGLGSGPVMIFRQIRLMVKAIRSSRQYLKNKLALYRPPEQMDHLI